MKQELPYLKKTKNGFDLIVDGAPFLALGGEFHNSSASDPVYMQEHVWPSAERLKGSFFLAPVYWETLEPEQGVFDFAQVDSLITQAREHGVRLALLWFGMWKGPESLYLPLWLKRTLRDSEFQRDENGRLLRQISPFAKRIVEADRAAYAALMRHLSAIDGDIHTVLMMQIENEPGTWFAKRDRSDAAETAFRDRVPARIREAFGVDGTWKEAFGDRAEEAFMCWAITDVIEGTARTGKQILPLPVFTNCVPASAHLHTAGGPKAENAFFWKRLAPSVDVLTPNVYDPDFTAITGPYAREDNPLMVPETALDKDVVSKLIWLIGSGGLMYSPFGIEDLFDAGETGSRMCLPKPSLPEHTAEALAEAYQIIPQLFPAIRKAREEARILTILQRPGERSGTAVPGFGGMLTLEGGDHRSLRLGGYRFDLAFGCFADPKQAPLGAAILIREAEDSFLFLGVDLVMTIRAEDPEETVFIDDKRELILRGGRLTEGRILNGDERSAITAGPMPILIRLTLSRHR